MRFLRITFLAGLVASAGCYHAVARAGQQAGAEETRTGWNLFWGIFDANFDITNCPNGIAYAEVWHPWWGFVPEILTAGIVSPQRLTYVCSAQAGMIQPGYAPPPPMPQYQPQPVYPPQAVAPPPPPPPPAPAAAPYQPPAPPPAAEEAAADDPPPAKPAKKAKKPAKPAKKNAKPATTE